jgi:predicted RNA-binding protein with PUA-like domain
MAARTGRDEGRQAPRRFWLLKSEPEKYSIDDLARDGTTPWDGVRNFQARNSMRDDMRVGDLAFFYHSNAKPMAIVGVARVCSAPYPDPSQFDHDSDYFDAGSDPADPRWIVVDVELVEKLEAPVTLAALKAERSLADMLVVQRGSRLSVQPVAAGHFKKVLAMAKARTRL